MDINSILTRAIEGGEIIKIIYHGGSHPGLVREVAPIRVEGDKVRARCYTSKGVKAFFISKIQLVGDEATLDQKQFDQLHSIVEKITDIASAHAELNEEMTSLGWSIMLSEDAFTLHHCFKNGKTKKTPVVGIAYDEFTTDIIWEEDYTMTEVTKKRIKPWVVTSKGKAARYFGKISKAVEAFIIEAKGHAPETC